MEHRPFPVQPSPSCSFLKHLASLSVVNLDFLGVTQLDNPLCLPRLQGYISNLLSGAQEAPLPRNEVRKRQLWLTSPIWEGISKNTSTLKSSFISNLPLKFQNLLCIKCGWEMNNHKTGFAPPPLLLHFYLVLQLQCDIYYFGASVHFNIPKYIWFSLEITV